MNKEKVTKRKGNDKSGYGDIYRVEYPVTFYFNKDGTYDGEEFDVEDTNDNEIDLIEELLHRLEDTCGLKSKKKKIYRYEE